MKVEYHVTSLEISKQLKEAGFEKESLFYWYFHPIDKIWHINYGIPVYSSTERYGSYIATEIVEELPNHGLSIYKVLGNLWCVEGQADNDPVKFRDEKLCDCLAKMWLWLNKEKNQESKQ